jgi:hypothetical protein
MNANYLVMDVRELRALIKIAQKESLFAAAYGKPSEIRSWALAQKSMAQSLMGAKESASS